MYVDCNKASIFLMSITSYAQNFEDVMLWRALAHVELGFYIDIGAQDPVIDSVSLAFYEHGWRGIDVEPLEHYAELLRQQRPGDLVIEAAVGDGPASLRFFEIPGTGISTADPVIAARHRSRGLAVSEITTQCIPLSAVLDVAGDKEVHWLKIDVEGFERQVLASWGSSATKPWIIVVESTVPLTQIDTHDAWEDLVIERGYHSVYFDGLNRYYLSDEHSDLDAAFLVPPNIFDDFALNGTASAPFHGRIDARYREQVMQAQFETKAIGDVLGQREREFSEKLLLQEHMAALERTQQAGLVEAARYDLGQMSARLREAEQAFKMRLEAKGRELAEQDAAHAATQRDFEVKLSALHEIANTQAFTIDAARAELAITLSSLSWRATAPCRIIWRWLQNAWIPRRFGDPTKEGRDLAVSFANVPASEIDNPGGETEFGGPNAEIGQMIDKGASHAKMPITEGAAADLRSILRLPQVEFVRCAYWTILQREADPDGIKHYVRRMRGGRPKLDILGDLYWSGEARKMRVKIPWLRNAVIRHKLARLPILGLLIWPVLVRGDMLEMERRVNYLEETVHSLTRSSRRRGADGHGVAHGSHDLNLDDQARDQSFTNYDTDEPDLPEMSKVAGEILVELSEAVEQAHGRAALKRTKRETAVRGY